MPASRLKYLPGLVFALLALPASPSGGQSVGSVETIPLRFICSGVEYPEGLSIRPNFELLVEVDLSLRTVEVVGPGMLGGKARLADAKVSEMEVSAERYAEWKHSGGGYSYTEVTMNRITGHFILSVKVKERGVSMGGSTYEGKCSPAGKKLF
jgi:hypothetical protein